MIKFPEQWHKVNRNLKFKKMVLTVGNVTVDIPLFLPITYKQEYWVEERFWLEATKVLMEM